ncbi:hypothetical protein ACFZC3_15420 [Streptomyces sp. NPDC007903]|uniref:hypothetical protein n=1 Tax=Streptomyces sp. NPDC007903 TaxID=3364786 RepID=UPI0036EF8209
MSSNPGAAQVSPQDKARTALFQAITEAAEAAKEYRGTARAESLKNLAEAYAWVSSPAQPH